MKMSHEARGRLVAMRKDLYTAPLSLILLRFAVLNQTASNTTRAI
jgi:hypothetical protein